MNQTDPLDDPIRKALKADFDRLYVREFTTDWQAQRHIRGIEIKIMSLAAINAYAADEYQRGFEEAKRFCQDEWNAEIAKAVQREYDSLIENCIPIGDMSYHRMAVPKEALVKRKKELEQSHE